MANNLDYKKTKFPVSKKGYSKIERKNNIWINVFYFENDFIMTLYYYTVYSVHISKQTIEDYMNLLLISDENKTLFLY